MNQQRLYTDDGEQELEHRNIADDDTIKEAIDEIVRLQDERNAINQAINAVFADLESKGIGRASLKLAIKVSRMDESEREDIRFGFTACCRATQIQMDLFGAD